MVGREFVADFGQHRRRLVRLHRQNQHFGKIGHLGVGRGHPGTGLLREGRARRRHGVAGDDLFGGDQSCTYKSLRKRRGHFARAEKADGEFRSHGAGFNSSDGRAEA